jgi:membrane associated rhomboid family serine protease
MIPLKDYPEPRRTIPWVTWGLIAINIAIFLYQVSLGPAIESFIFAYSVVPAALVRGIPQTDLIQQNLPFHTPNPVYLTLITSMFMHGGWLHLGGNMLYLYIFGDNVEDRMGHFMYLLFYLFCGLVASLAQILVDPNSPVPSLGASGAIAGVLASYLVLFPWAGVRTVIIFVVFVTITTVPAIVLIGVWFVLQFFNGVASLAYTGQGMGGVAYFAHIGGFIAGFVITWLFKPRQPPPMDITYPYFPRYPNTGPRSGW